MMLAMPHNCRQRAIYADGEPLLGNHQLVNEVDSSSVGTKLNVTVGGGRDNGHLRLTMGQQPGPTNGGITMMTTLQSTARPVAHGEKRNRPWPSPADMVNHHGFQAR